MTNFEAISTELYPFEVPDTLIEKKCIEAALDAQDDYSIDNQTSVAKGTIAILRNLIELNSESNGGYALSYDTDKLKERIFFLAKDNGLDDIADEFKTTPTIEFLPD